MALGHPTLSRLALKAWVLNIPATKKIGQQARVERLTDPSGWAPRQIARLQVRRFGMEWRESDIRDMLRSGAMICFTHVTRRTGAPLRLNGYVLFRTMAAEGEILSVAVRGQARRRGIAAILMAHVLQDMRDAKVQRVFLEVGEANRAAINFYKRTNFEIVGQRNNYYRSISGHKSNALVLRWTAGSQNHIVVPQRGRVEI